MIGWPYRLKGISGGERKRLAFASEVVIFVLTYFLKYKNILSQLFKKAIFKKIKTIKFVLLKTQ